MRDIHEIINEWFETLEASGDARTMAGDEFLDYAEGLNINELVIENGIKTIWLENGLYYIAHGEAIRETDGEKAKAIIEELEACGFEFREV